MKFYVIAWRPHGRSPFFFRGDARYEIYLPYISNEYVSDGWVRDIAYARLFKAYPDFTARSFSKKLDASRIRIFPYDGDVLETHIIRPTLRPRERHLR
ncbi:hypothetical protein COU17_02510 [Candidatus Kaiserbacteria bacterium CG10_big_fil_rev_8_21_14_0_10_49_17]|uniref:Uncharacterized protein n=1 Tax=Candidatus Kaiserbacteria bacterium CG10_big_fil_rev_8_21_14_0_10_49_17 TaxID=1974609 RepID=A0A2M6WE28_9BACT|nr:MAG: hypothetical protein COU17_02510 [Candidatus Kaiserbacteria bacterium CG10_big_fil_rev_8_21_14_0_10_49_17]